MSAPSRLGRPNLTRAELLAVLPPIADGATIAEAARQLHLSIEATKMRLYRLRVALGARNTVHLVSIAHREGLLPAGQDGGRP